MPIVFITNSDLGMKKSKQLSLLEEIGYDVNSIEPNPMARVYGTFPGKKCKQCIHLYCKQFSKKYYKCRLRKNTNGSATDHRVNWTACSKFSPNINDVMDQILQIATGYEIPADIGAVLEESYTEQMAGQALEGLLTAIENAELNDSDIVRLKEFAKKADYVNSSGSLKALIQTIQNL